MLENERARGFFVFKKCCGKTEAFPQHFFHATDWRQGLADDDDSKSPQGCEGMEGKEGEGHALGDIFSQN